jgi:hypothetical protein
MHEAKARRKAAEARWEAMTGPQKRADLARRQAERPANLMTLARQVERERAG